MCGVLYVSWLMGCSHVFLYVIIVCGFGEHLTARSLGQPLSSLLSCIKVKHSVSQHVSARITCNLWGRFLLHITHRKTLDGKKQPLIAILTLSDKLIMREISYESRNRLAFPLIGELFIFSLLYLAVEVAWCRGSPGKVKQIPSEEPVTKHCHILSFFLSLRLSTFLHYCLSLFLMLSRVLTAFFYD